MIFSRGNSNLGFGRPLRIKSQSYAILVCIVDATGLPDSNALLLNSKKKGKEASERRVDRFEPAIIGARVH